MPADDERRLRVRAYDLMRELPPARVERAVRNLPLDVLAALVAALEAERPHRSLDGAYARNWWDGR